MPDQDARAKRLYDRYQARAGGPAWETLSGEQKDVWRDVAAGGAESEGAPDPSPRMMAFPTKKT